MTRVYSHKLGVGEVALAPGNSSLVYTSPPGVVTVVREIAWDLLVGSSSDEATCSVLDFASGETVILFDVGLSTPGPLYPVWVGRLVMTAGDLLFIDNVGAGTGGHLKVWVSGYQLGLP